MASESETPAAEHRPHAHIALADGTTAEPGAPSDGQAAKVEVVPEKEEQQQQIEEEAEAQPEASVSGYGSSSTPRNSHGWDGKLRVPKKGSVQLANPEALSDPDYSDEDNVVPGETISADEDLLADEDPDAEEVLCVHARVQDLDALGLERFRRCERLCLRENSIDTVESAGLRALAPTLRELDLYDNLVAHMRGVDALPLLTTLDLSFNKIRHIRHLAPLTQLRELYLVANKIAELHGLAHAAPTLRLLELGSNRLRDLAPGTGLLDAGRFLALEELWLAKNKITSLAGLAQLPRLRLLSIQSNRIRDLSPLRAVPSLEELYASHNALDSLESLGPLPTEATGDEQLQPQLQQQPLSDTPPDTPTDTGPDAAPPASAPPGTPPGAPALPLLRVLDIGNNMLTSLRGIEQLTRLEEVWASSNRLLDFADVERALADKTNLETVYLEGNPLQLRAPALYRNKVRLALPQVRQIDATYVR